MSNEVETKVWTTRNYINRGSPYLIRITGAFINDTDHFINLDSICESGSDEYIHKDELFLTEKEALNSCIKDLHLKKQRLKIEYLKATDTIESYGRRLNQIDVEFYEKYTS